MRASQKTAVTLERRLKTWLDMPADGMRGITTKMVRRHDGHGTTAYHRPGSQNRKKGVGARRSARH